MNELHLKSVPSLSRRRVHGRAVNAVADLLRRHLRVPEIYIEPRIYSAVRAADILAVDEGGSGDLHAVDIRAMTSLPTRSQLHLLLEEIRAMPFHFRYLALPSFTSDLSEPYAKFGEFPELFDDTGIGRVGIISFSSQLLSALSEIDKSSVRIVVRPERFRVLSDKLAAVEKFLSKTKPDMEVRM